MENIETLKYPFNKMTPTQIVDLANKINELIINHGRTIMIEINGNYYDRSDKKQEDYICLASYIKFLGKEVEFYQKYSSRFKSIGLCVPSEYEFINALISKIEKCIDFYINENVRPWPIDILNSLKQSDEIYEVQGYLYNIIDLLLKEKNYQVKPGSAISLEKKDFSYDKIDLSCLVNCLVNELELNNEKKLILSKNNK